MAVVKFVEDIVSLLGLTKEKTKELTKLAKKFYDTVKAEKAGAKKAKGAKKSDSDVKRPLNAYLSFSGAVRKQVKEVNPSMNPKELTAEIAKQWNEEKEANTETYQKYADQAAKELEEYKKTKSEKSEKSASDASSGSESDSEKPEKKKRAPSAYNVFYSLKYAEFSSNGMSAADAKKEISEVWGKLTPEEKEEYKGKELSPKKTKPAEKKSAAKPAADAKVADAKAADAAKPSVKKTKTADAKDAAAKSSDAKPADAKTADTKDATAKPEKKAKAEKADTKKTETKKDDTKPKKAKKDEEVTEDEEEDIDLDAFNDVPPPKKNAAKKDVPK
jgi:hypothetical protein